MILALGYIGAYVLLMGVASFIEVPAGRGFSAFQLNALIRVGSLATAAIAIIALHGFAFPSWSSALGGLGIGLITGLGSVFYCVALKYLRVSLVVTLSNQYLVITTLLGVIVLREPVTATKVAGFGVTLVGVVLLSHAPTRYGVNLEDKSDKPVVRTHALLIMAAYVAMIGVGAFLEKPALKSLDPTELNFLMAISMTAVAGVALVLRGPRPSLTRHALGASAVGAMIGVGSVFYFLGLRGLPVSIAAASSNGYIVITVVLSTIVLGQPLTRSRAAAMVMTILGVGLLALSAG